ncbi:MAG: ThiF family adenylyltransferase [Deltaproteobacteria bacterium]|nr:ThiF family adenylyltransferase [Deltaproteobacteria bacterium]
MSSNRPPQPDPGHLPADRCEFLAAAFQSNIGIINPAEQQKLHEAVVAIPGLGGVGGTHLISLVRAGVGNFKLADFDRFEPKNINRRQPLPPPHPLPRRGHRKQPR